MINRCPFRPPRYTNTESLVVYQKKVFPVSNTEGKSKTGNRKSKFIHAHSHTMQKTGAYTSHNFQTMNIPHGLRIPEILCTKHAWRKQFYSHVNTWKRTHFLIIPNSCGVNAVLNLILFHVLITYHLSSFAIVTRATKTTFCSLH